MSQLRLALVSLALLAVSGITSFVVVVLLYNPDAEASGVPAADPHTWNVNTLQEAKNKAGYPIASPTSLSTDFARNDIIVNKLATDHFERYFVQQSWTLNEDPLTFLMLHQGPGLGTIDGDGPVLINDVTGERQLLPAVPPDRPRPILVLFWKADDTTYTLVGSLGGSMTEAALLEIAGSVSLPSTEGK